MLRIIWVVLRYVPTIAFRALWPSAINAMAFSVLLVFVLTMVTSYENAAAFLAGYYYLVPMDIYLIVFICMMIDDGCLRYEIRVIKDAQSRNKPE